jgi:tRNA modification GTPase
MLLGNLHDLNSSTGDTALAVYMPNPNSYTGDDVVELHIHGGILTAKNTLEATLAAGARLAEPGEFTFRAFINGKLDLTQAEAVGDIITAQTDMALHLAEKQLQGNLSTTVKECYTNLVALLAECESRLDFVDENLDFDSTTYLTDQLDTILNKINKLYATREDGVILRNGVRAVIAGRPNVGKSSLLNLLLGFDRAIVTKIPGTTRDTLEELAHIRGIPVKLSDTAGIRESDNLVESIGIERSKSSLEQSEIILWLLDGSSDNLEDECKDMLIHIKGYEDKTIAIWNKMDNNSVPLPNLSIESASISVKEQHQIDNFLDLYETKTWERPHTDEPEMAINTRHADLLQKVIKTLPEAQLEIQDESWELTSVHLQLAISLLGEITGETASPDILDNIFSKFCIGK